ncbi:Uncharacterised protein [Mycobacteroides abscessus subsp. abscessus]|uniref:hypothetical protein n=1 Tax=Mycobacteroides abscessus TaxID=36809 RepID=UPI0009A7E31E|nr:hypothetical protein [Mycobacteroides abscessus]SLJ22810.1 Uncharacterised protein [Mycobacteroides abscessus subsp. abscessus]
MTETLIDTEMRWAADPLPRIERAAPVIDAWTTDDEIAEQAAKLARVYGNRYDVDTILRLFRSQLRASALTKAKR